MQESKLPWEIIGPRPQLLIEELDAEIRAWSATPGEVLETILDETGRAWHLVWLDEAIEWAGEMYAYALVHKINPVSPIDETPTKVEILLVADPDGLTEDTFDPERLSRLGFGTARLLRPTGD